VHPLEYGKREENYHCDARHRERSFQPEPLPSSFVVIAVSYPITERCQEKVADDDLERETTPKVDEDDAEFDGEGSPSAVDDVSDVFVASSGDVAWILAFDEELGTLV
jgi:hypothetical protein